MAVEVFDSLAAAQKLTAAWREAYDHYRPHGSLGYVTPAEYAATLPKPYLQSVEQEINAGQSIADYYRTANLPSVPTSNMMLIMRNPPGRPTSRRKEDTHERIVEVAARAIRRSGYSGTGVADIMKEAGLTHGGFYAHFASREAMLVEAADRAGAAGVTAMERIAAAAAPPQALEGMMRAYLSTAHVEDLENGCAIAALGSEMPRQSPEVRRAATRRIKEMIDLVARQSPDWGQPGAHDHALVIVATMVGTLMLARAVDDPKLSDALREAALKQLIHAGS